MVRASGCHLSLYSSVMSHLIFLAAFFSRNSLTAVLDPCLEKVLSSTLSITDKNGDRSRGTGDRSELKPRCCENVNYHVWPDDK